MRQQGKEKQSCALALFAAHKQQDLSSVVRSDVLLRNLCLHTLSKIHENSGLTALPFLEAEHHGLANYLHVLTTKACAFISMHTLFSPSHWKKHFSTLTCYGSPGKAPFFFKKQSPSVNNAQISWGLPEINTSC